jgi:hypothetical protein
MSGLGRKQPVPILASVGGDTSVVGQGRSRSQLSAKNRCSYSQNQVAAARTATPGVASILEIHTARRLPTYGGITQQRLYPFSKDSGTNVRFPLAREQATYSLLRVSGLISRKLPAFQAFTLPEFSTTHTSS